MIRELGSGSFGVVYLAQDNETGKMVAVKRLLKMGKLVSREIDILQRIAKAENCTEMLSCFYTVSAKNVMVQNMVFDYFPDNLENYINKRREKRQAIPPAVIQKFAYQLLNGLAAIHKVNVLHRDLKPENLLLKDEHLAISDFGSSKILKPHMKSTPYIVSRFYRAPELLLCVTEYNEKIDVWAAGCIIAEMCNKEPVFQGKDDGEQVKAIMSNLGPLPKAVMAKFAAKGMPFKRSFLTKISKDHRPRNNIERWVSVFKEKKLAADLLGRLLAFDPDERISAAEAIAHPFFAALHKPNRSSSRK